MNTAVLHMAGVDNSARAQAVGVGLWVFIGVASTLFALFGVAYVMRLSGSDGAAIALPWQLWLSTALLAAGSLLLQGASVAAQKSPVSRAQPWLLAGGACGVAFLGVQWWAWQSLQATNVLVSSHPAASFFYLLTALHGLHVVGGLAAWALTVESVAHRAAPAEPATWRIALCARYWHFLLALWVLLFAGFHWITPDLARFICGVPR